MDRWNTLNLELIICPYWANVLCVMRIYSPAGGKEYYSQMSMSPDTGTSTQIKSISPTSSSFLCRCTVIVMLNFWWRSSLKVWSSHSLHFSPPWSSIQGTQIFLVSLDSQLLLLYLQQPTGAPNESPTPTWRLPRSGSWANRGLHFNLFLSLRNHWLSLTDVQCHEKAMFKIFFPGFGCDRKETNCVPGYSI